MLLGLITYAAGHLYQLLAFLVVLGVLVFVHESGHYLAARWRGVHVEAFSIGFGRALTSWTDRHGTVWKIGWLPLGGYVKLHGQERPEDVPEETRAAWQQGRTFHGKGIGSRAIVVAAGPAANFVLAILVFAVLFAVAGRPVATPVVSTVVAGSAADTAGLQPGDRIDQIGTAKIASFEDIQHQVAPHPGDTLSFVVTHDGKPETLKVTLGARGDGASRIGVLGISGAQMMSQRLDPLSALVAGVDQTWEIASQTLVGVGQMITGQRGTQELGGPLRIAELSGQAASMGIVPLVSLIGFLSVSLGLINLFPIPVLDGGHLLFYALEAILGRPVPQVAQEYGYRAGFAAIMALAVFVTWNDLTQMGIFHWFARMLGS
jgi:regulator of sigma E protease